MNISKNIRKIRELKGFSQQYVANVLGMSQRHLSRLENDETPIKLSTLNRICRILDVSFETLLSFDERVLFQPDKGSGEESHGIFTSLKEQYEK